MEQFFDVVTDTIFPIKWGEGALLITTKIRVSVKPYVICLAWRSVLLGKDL
jgi:hypothetical protein